MNTYQIYRSYQREYLRLIEEAKEMDRQLEGLGIQLEKEADEDQRQQIIDDIEDLCQQHNKLQEKIKKAVQGMIKFSPVEIT